MASPPSPGGGFGSSVSMSADGTYVGVSTPFVGAGVGAYYTYYPNEKKVFVTQNSGQFNGYLLSSAVNPLPAGVPLLPLIQGWALKALSRDSSYCTKRIQLLQSYEVIPVSSTANNYINQCYDLIVGAPYSVQFINSNFQQTFYGAFYLDQRVSRY